jgi:membrane protein implicated in regulation of membrane protease activity
MSGWVWAIVACAFAVGELLTGGFFLAPFALGGLVAAIVAAVGAGSGASVVVFALVSLLSLLVLRPLAVASMQRVPALRTGSAALVGKQAIVLERIANHEGVGCVKIDGEIWTARSLDDDTVIEAGRRVDVVGIRGATALVTE